MLKFFRNFADRF